MFVCSKSLKQESRHTVIRVKTCKLIGEKSYSSGALSVLIQELGKLRFVKTPNLGAFNGSILE